MRSNSKNLGMVLGLAPIILFVLKAVYSWHQEWYVHMSVKALKLLAVQRGFFLE